VEEAGGGEARGGVDRETEGILEGDLVMAMEVRDVVEDEQLFLVIKGEADEDAVVDEGQVLFIKGEVDGEVGADEEVFRDAAAPGTGDDGADREGFFEEPA